MRKLRSTLVISVLVTALLVSVPGYAGERTESRSYVGGLEVLIIDCDGVGVGGVCFPVRGGDAFATIDIADATGREVGAIWAFEDTNGEFLASDFFCDSAVASVPKGSVQLDVFVGSVVLPGLRCLGHQTPGAATTGAVSVTFSSGPKPKEGPSGKKTYDQPFFFFWEKAELDVVIVPPSHGQLVNGRLSNPNLLNGGDPNELDPYKNSYLKAITKSVADWQLAIEEFGDDWLRNGVRIRSRVVDPGTPPQALRDAEIIITTDETKTFVLGFATNSRPCIVDNSKFFITSFTFADMYNVNGQEFGHCLGLGHATGPEDDVVIAHDVMNGEYADIPGLTPDDHLHCMSNLNVKGLEQVFGPIFGKPGGVSVSIMPKTYRQIACVS